LIPTPSQYESGLTVQSTVKNKAMVTQDRKTSKIAIDILIQRYVEGVGIKMDSNQINILVEDIHDTYKYECLEDIAIVLRNARRGKYQDRSQQFRLNMIMFNAWMAQHLEEKAIERERQLENAKDMESSQPVVDLMKEVLKRAGIDTSKPITTSNSFDEEKYRQVKSEYIKKKQDENNK
jgi:hypothetical protein